MLFINKAVVLCSDSAAVNISVANDLNLEHEPCLCHSLNRLFKSFFEDLPHIVNDTMKLCSKLHSLYHFTDYIKVQTADDGRHKRKNISSFTEIRWFSAVKTLLSFKSLVVHIVNYIDNHSDKIENYAITYSEEDLTYIQELATVLEKLYQIELKMESDEHFLGKMETYLAKAVKVVY